MNAPDSIRLLPAHNAGLYIDRSSLLPGRLDSVAWHLYTPSLAPRCLPFAGVHTEDGTRSLLWVNYDQRAPDGARLERTFQPPDSVPAVRLELEHVVLPEGVSSSGAFHLQILDATGAALLSSTSFTPTTIPGACITPALALTQGRPYRVRVLVRSGATQATFLCGRLRVRPIGASRALYNDFWRLDVHPATIHASNEPMYEQLKAWRNPRHAEMSSFAHYQLLTDASEFDVEYYDTVNRHSGNRSYPSVWVDGEPISPVIPVKWNAATFGTVKVPGARRGVPRTFNVHAGPQMASGVATTANLDAIRGENRGVFPVGVYLPGGAIADVVLPRPRVVVALGDSKGAGAHTSFPGMNSWHFMMTRKGMQLISHAAGGDNLAHLVGATPSLEACRPLARKLVQHRPAEVILQISRNDFANQKMSPANVVAMVGYLADALHEADPSVLVRIMTYTRENTENDVAGVSWDSQRDALGALAASRAPWCEILWGGDWWTLEDAPSHNHADTIHPNDRGQEKMTAGSSGDEFPFSPIHVPNLFTWGHAGGELVGGLSTGTPAGFGSNPPSITISGTSTVVGLLRIEMIQGGTRGGTPAPRFAWSLTDGGTWVEDDVAMPANGVYVLGSTGLTVTFSAGTYNNLHYYRHPLGVGQVVDASGNGRHWPVGVPSNPPRFELDSLGHQPAFSFSSVLHNFRLTGINLPAPYAIFVVGKKNSTNVGAIIGRHGIGSGALLYVNTATTIAFADGQVQRQVTVNPLLAHAYGVIVDGASSALIVDGVSTTVSLNNVTCTGLVLGGDTADNFPWDGVIPEVLVYSSRPSQSAIRAIFRRFRHKYGTPEAA